MIYQTTHYVNRQSERQYRLELAQDLLGDYTVSAFYGQHRDVHYQPTLAKARQFFQAEHERRLRRHYEACTTQHAKVR